MRIILSQLPKSERVIAYLDAHWESYIPTAVEIESLISWGGPWIALIDDFKIETDLTYGFDTNPSVWCQLQTLFQIKQYVQFHSRQLSSH